MEKRAVYKCRTGVSLQGERLKAAKNPTKVVFVGFSPIRGADVH